VIKTGAVVSGGEEGLGWHGTTTILFGFFEAKIEF
jgi:hypothetical protein